MSLVEKTCPGCTAMGCEICNRPIMPNASPREFALQHKQEPRPMKCDQEGCDNDAAFRFTWPGKDEAGICEDHKPKLKGIAAAMGLHVQTIPLD